MCCFAEQLGLRGQGTALARAFRCLLGKFCGEVVSLMLSFPLHTLRSSAVRPGGYEAVWEFPWQCAF
jgi:hypothetical protein